jgi:hypothetical protein
MAICVGTPMIIAGIAWGLANFLFLLIGRKTTGRVASERVNVGERDAQTYSPIVEFQDGNGRLVKVTARLGFSRGFGALPLVGSTVRVVYAPWNPSRARIANFQNLFLVPFIFTALGGFIVLYDYKSALLAADWLAGLFGS